MKTAIVTGATSGIGRAAAIALAEEGCWVLACGQDIERGKEVRDRLGKRGKGDFMGADLAEDGVHEAIVERATSETGRLDILVNSAGVHFLASIDHLQREQLDRLMAINLRGAMLMCRAALPALCESGGGVVINVASEAGLVAVPNQVAYNVSKAGMIMLSKSLAVDHAGDNVRAISICPGTTHTPLVDAAIASAEDPEKHLEWLSSSRPAKRLGTKEEIARAIVFAASDQVSYMTGSEIVIDGGYTAV